MRPCSSVVDAHLLESDREVARQRPGEPDIGARANAPSGAGIARTSEARWCLSTGTTANARRPAVASGDRGSSTARSSTTDAAGRREHAREERGSLAVFRHAGRDRGPPDPSMRTSPFASSVQRAAPAAPSVVTAEVKAVLTMLIRSKLAPVARSASERRRKDSASRLSRSARACSSTSWAPERGARGDGALEQVVRLQGRSARTRRVPTRGPATRR